MPIFCTLAKLIDDYSSNIEYLLNALINSEADDAYIYLRAGDGTTMKKSAFLPLPKTLIQELAVLQSTNNFTNLEVDIYHSVFTKNIGLHEVILSFDEIENGDDYKERYLPFKYNKKKIYYWIRRTRQRYESNLASQWESVNDENCITSNAAISDSSIFIKTDSKIVKDLESSRQCNSWANLSPEEQKASVDLRNIAGIERTKNLTKILDKNWEYHSTYVNIIIKAQEAILLRGEGNQSCTIRKRIEQYIQKECPNISAKALDQLATVANPDKFSKHKI